MHHEYVERVVNLIKPDSHRIYNMSVQEAEQRILSGDPNGVEGIDGSFALLAKEENRSHGKVHGSPQRYFLAKREEGPALIVAERMDAISEWLQEEGLGDQFHPQHPDGSSIMSWKSC